MSNPRIQWIRILFGGLFAEVALIVAIVPVGLRLGDNFLHYTAPPGSFIMCFLGALWVGRRIESRFILHGTLVGVVAALIYVALTRAQPEPFAYNCGPRAETRGRCMWWLCRPTTPLTVRGATRSPLNADCVRPSHFKDMGIRTRSL
jgi:putative membrane protein (TIGR04086 family)